MRVSSSRVIPTSFIREVGGRGPCQFSSSPWMRDPFTRFIAHDDDHRRVDLKGGTERRGEGRFTLQPYQNFVGPGSVGLFVDLTSL